MKKAIISLIFLLSLPAALLAATTADLRADAPDRYVVQPGDTLWGIATRFLKSPWRWPELWKGNTSLRNPHRIYPGDVLVLDRSSSSQVTMRVEHVSPRARIEPREADAIQSIPPSAIEPFLTKPMLVTANELDRAAEIIAVQEDRVALAAGNVAYVRGINPKDTRWEVFRRGDPLIDPETNQTLGFVGTYLGEAQLAATGPVSTVSITKAALEIYRGDKLLPVRQEPPIFGYIPHAPEKPVRARIISTYGGVWETGPLGIVALSKGSRDGLEVGHVLALYRDLKSQRFETRTDPLFGRQGPSGDDKRIPYVPAEMGQRDKPIYYTAEPIRPEQVDKLPAERYGLVMIFRTFDRASFGIIMQATRGVTVADIVTNP